jgi:hypothetical protein
LSPISRRAAGLLGAVSGSLAWGVLVLFDKLDIDYSLLPNDHVPIIQPLSMIPGLLFGVVFGAALRRARGIGAARFLGYVLASGVGYLAAYHAAYFTVLSLDRDHPNPYVLAWAVGGLLGGLAGSLVLGIAGKFLLRVSAAEALGLPVLSGTLFGALLLLVSLEREGHGVPQSLLVFFALWQGAYAFSLAPLLRTARA